MVGREVMEANRENKFEWVNVNERGLTHQINMHEVNNKSDNRNESNALKQTETLNQKRFIRIFQIVGIFHTREKKMESDKGRKIERE